VQRKRERLENEVEKERQLRDLKDKALTEARGQIQRLELELEMERNLRKKLEVCTSRCHPFGALGR
jgi:hypothetical protein